MHERDIVWLEDSDATNQSLVGGKFASLARLQKSGANVPLAFSVSTGAYSEFISGFRERLKSALSTVDFSTLASIERAAESVRGMITSGVVPEELSGEVKEAYRELASRAGVHGDMLPVAVRSSGTLEDSSDSSLAGQHETYLWVTGGDAVLKRVVECWASLFTGRSIRYRDSKGMDQLSEEMAVAVQVMVRSSASGVMFTLNPANGDPSKICIESSWGLGEAIVGGLVTPDLFLLDKVTFEVLQKRVNRKEREFVVQGHKVVERSVEEARAVSPSVSDEVVQHLAKLGKALEKQYGCPQDIEWAIDSELHFPQNTFILQARPETAWQQTRKDRVRASRDAMDFLVDKLIRGERIG